MAFEYMDRIVMFQESAQGLSVEMSFMNDLGRDGWELVSAIPLIAPNRDGIAYGTVGTHLIFKRQKAVS